MKTETNVIITNGTELLQAIRNEFRTALAEVQTEQKEGKKYVFGLNGIAELFGVSKVTATQYKNTFLAGAISQRGRKIICDVEKAKRLFAENKKEEYFNI